MSEQETKLQEVGVSNVDISMKSNEELVSKGEKIISDFVPKFVSYFYPRFPMEGIQSIHDYLLSNDVLGHVSKNLGTTDLILSAEYPVETETYSTTLKAIIGALYECSGLNRANLFVRDFIITQLEGKDIHEFLQIKDPLKIVNEILNRDNREPCEPRIICKSGVNTILANYHVGLYSNKELVGHCEY